MREDARESIRILSLGSCINTSIVQATKIPVRCISCTVIYDIFINNVAEVNMYRQAIFQHTEESQLCTRKIRTSHI